jgi:hypothetical protein
VAIYDTVLSPEEIWAHYVAGSDSEAPFVFATAADPNPVPVGEFVSLSATVDDSQTGNSLIAAAEYTIDSGPCLPMSASDGAFDEPVEIVEATLGSFDTPDVHTLCVRGTDAAVNTSTEECAFLAVYDPEGGFVTGGGWIDSPQGAYVADPSLTGKATFGFVSKYKKGADTPTGQTEFQFKVADLNFHSDNYQWLVAAGPQAKFKGTGTINGAGDFGFMVTAIDGQINGGGGTDKFRIKIWEIATDVVVYDNKIGESDDSSAATELGGGSIVIHDKK